MNDIAIDDFKKKLAEAEKLIQEQDFIGALNLLEKMKRYDDRKFDDSLVHHFYMLYSNVQSRVHGDLIYENLLPLSEKMDKIAYSEVDTLLKKKGVDLDSNIIKRELEILILKGIAPWTCNNEDIIFKQ